MIGGQYLGRAASFGFKGEKSVPCANVQYAPTCKRLIENLVRLLAERCERLYAFDPLAIGKFETMEPALGQRRQRTGRHQLIFR